MDRALRHPDPEECLSAFGAADLDAQFFERRRQRVVVGCLLQAREPTRQKAQGEARDPTARRPLQIEVVVPVAIGSQLLGHRANEVLDQSLENLQSRAACRCATTVELRHNLRCPTRLSYQAVAQNRARYWFHGRGPFSRVASAVSTFPKYCVAASDALRRRF